MKKLIYYILPILLLSSCEKFFEFEQEVGFSQETTETKIVVQSVIQTGYPAYAIVTKTQPYFSEVTEETINELFVTDANIQISNKEGETVEVLFHADQGMPLSASLPAHIILEIQHTEPGVKGNTATNTFKPATTETGAPIQVPLFINEGDKIKIDTSKGSYIERIK